MQRMKLFKKFLLPGGLCGAIPAIKPVPPSPETPVDCANEEVKFVRPSELPLYVHDPPSTKQAPCTEQDYHPSFLEEGIRTIRLNIQGVLKKYTVVTDTVKNTINTGVAHTQVSLDYLREEDNSLPRVGAVVLGGLTGFIFGLRGGKFKKLVYTSAGILSVGAICYPREAKESLIATKHYVNIAYNFIYGVKPGDENQLEIQWPELPSFKVPTSLSEFVDLAGNIGSNGIAAVKYVIGKATDAVQSSEENPSKVAEDKKKD